MGINEKIPIDITFPTRVAMELHKRGIKECDLQQLKVEQYHTVLISHESGKKVDLRIWRQDQPLRSIWILFHLRQGFTPNRTLQITLQ